MGAVKYFRKLLLYTVIILMSFSSLLNVNASFKGQNERIASEDLEQYVVVDDPFERSFFGGIIQRAKIRVNQWFNGEGTIYENTTLDSIVINGQSLSISEIINNPNKLKELISSRDEEVGLQAIEVTNDTQDKYDYKEYLDLLIKNAQPMQVVFDTTWKKESGPYYILGEVQVMKGVTLTIEAGTEVYFRSMPSTKHRSGILVDGELILEGSESEQIKLAPYGTDSTSGSWKGIYITERGSLNAKHTVIEKAGALTESAIYSYGPVILDHVEINQTKGSSVTAFSDAIITNSLFKDNEKYGIDLYRYNKSFDTVVRSNKLEGNEIAGRIIVRQTKIPDYDVSDNTATSTDLNGFILGGDIIGDMSFTHPGKNLPYVLTNTHDVYGEMKPFTIYPRSEVDFTDTVVKVVAKPKFSPEHGIVINGTLNLNNSTITSLRDNMVASKTDRTEDVPASNRDWSGLVVGESGTLNINQSTIKYANEAVYTHGSVHLNEATIENVFSGVQGDGKFVIHDSTFINLEAPAFEYYAGKEPLDILVRNSTFTDINDVLGKVKIYQSGGELDLVNLEANQVKKHGIELTGSFNLDTTISQPGTNLPYLIPQLVINKSAKIDVTGDTILKVENGSLMGYKAGIDVYGQLNLNGTSSNRVTVTSLRDDDIGGDSNGDEPSTKPDAGDWGSITYHSSSKNRDSQITYSDIKYGGDQHQGYALGGDGKFNIQHSTVADSSEAGIGVLGTITIEKSRLEGNHGYGVHVHSNDNFSVTMNNNHFKDNLDYAAFVEFGSTLDHIEVSGNEADNNFINGVGITGTVRYDLELSPAGDNFAYVVPDDLEISEGSTLTLKPDTVIKFDTNSQLDVKGHLNIQGSENNKVYFTSLLDDLNDKDDTNNDLNATEPYTGAWKGIIYYPDSEGTFAGFECIYSELNMDYARIPYLKAFAKGDDDVAISERYGAYIEKNDENYEVKIYDFYTHDTKVISSSEVLKTNIMVDTKDSVTTVAWIEDGTIKYGEINSKKINSISTDYSNVEYAYLQDNNIVFIDAGCIYYGDLNDDDKIFVKGESKTFKPVINENYLFYYDEEEADDKVIQKLYRRDVDSGEEYHIMTTYDTFKYADLYGDDIALLGSYVNNNRNEILVGDIPSWTAIQPSQGLAYYSNIALYKNKLTYSINNKLGTRPATYIADSSPENKLDGDDHYLTIGYNTTHTDLGENSFIFTDSDLVYLLNIESPATNDTFVHEKTDQKIQFDRGLSLGANLGISIGGSFEIDGVFEPGVKFSTSREGTLGYKLHKNGLNSPYAISIDREILDSITEGLSLDIGVGIKDILDVNLFGVSASRGITQLRNDSHTFEAHQTSTYKDLGLLTGTGLVQFMPKHNVMLETVKNMLVYQLEKLSNVDENSQKYEQSIGLGVNTSISSYAGIDVKLGKLGSIGAKVESAIDTSSMAILGKEKTEEDENQDFVKFKSSNSADYFQLAINFGLGDNTEGEEGQDKNSTWDIGLKLPKSLVFEQEMKENMVMETTLKSNGDLILSYVTGAQNPYGYKYTYTYTVKDAVEELSEYPEFIGLMTLANNLNSVSDDGGLSLSQFTIDEKNLVMGFFSGLITILTEDVEVEYEVTLTKADSIKLDLEFSESGNLIDDSGKQGSKSQSYAITGAEISGAIGIGGSADDEVSIIIDSGKMKNGKILESHLIMASIPIKDESMISVLYNIVNGFGQQIMPKTMKYKNNQTTYEDVTVTLPGNHNLRSATFISTDVNIEEGSNGKYSIDENQYLYGKYMYLESKDKDKEVISSYPSGSTLTFDIQAGGSVQQAAIYQYDTSQNNWIKIGGKIIDNGDGTGKVTIKLEENGQYALGFDTSQPKIIFKHKEVELSSGAQLFPNDIINIQIIDDFPLSEFIINDKEDIYYPNIPYIIESEIGTYTLTVSYKDKDGNEFSRSINYKIVEPEISLIGEENSIIKDEVLQENVEDSNDITDDSDQNETELNTEENSSDEVTINQDEDLILQESDKESSDMTNDLDENEKELNTEEDSFDGVTTNQDEALILQENNKESNDMTNDLNQNETELNTEKDSYDEVTTNSDEDLIESEE